jgi:aminopeptidase YwaD
MREYLTVCLIACCASLTVAQPRQNLLDPIFRDIFAETLSGEIAKDHVIQITRFNRVQASRGYRASAQYVLQQLRSYGFTEQEAFIESFPSDGKRIYQTWQSPSGWDISSAELRMLEPYNERIVGYPDIAMSVITCSQPGDTTAELVWVGSGVRDDDYTGKNVRGKFVLATGYGGEVHRLAVLKYGARAVVCYLDDERAKEYPDMLQYTGMWPRPEELGRVTFGFNITHRQGEKLRDLLTAGKKVVLHGRVSGIGLEPYFMDVVVARIAGSNQPEEEFVLSAHLDHPKESANDNASGSAAVLDIAGTLRQLISAGRLPRPRRSIRFVWVPEWNGTMAYIDAHPEITGPALKWKFLANVNMDMVGENLELVHSQLIVTRPPDSTPSLLGDVVENMAAMIAEMDVRSPRGSHSRPNYVVESYGGGSDHMMFIDRKIPGVMLVHSDYTHHTSEDTPDKIDPVELKRSELIGAGTIWYLATMRQHEGIDATYLVAANAAHRLGTVARQQELLLQSAAKDSVLPIWGEAENVIKHAAVRERAALQSVLLFVPDDQIRQTDAALEKQVDFLEESILEGFRDLVVGRGIRAKVPPSREQRPDLRVPDRLTRGPLDFGLPGSKLSAAESEWYRSKEFTLDGDMRFELVNFIDGQRTVSDIRDALSAEFTPIPTAVVTRYLDDLVKVGVVRWK